MPQSPLPLRPSARMTAARRPRSRRWRRLRRSAGLYWLTAALLAVGGARILLATAREAEAARRAWGPGHEVMVATRSLPAGTVIGPGDTARRRWPTALLPAGAVTEPPLGRTVTAPVVEGEAVNSARLAPGGVTGAAALLSGNRRAVAVPTEPGRLALAVGDRVELVAISPEGRPVVVSGDAGVLAVTDDSLTVVVDAADGPAVAAAVAAGPVTPLLRPP
jgi:pilus assembly protein CpaB